MTFTLAYQILKHFFLRCSLLVKKSKSFLLFIIKRIKAAWSHCRGVEEPHSGPEPRVADPDLAPYMLNYFSPISSLG